MVKKEHVSGRAFWDKEMQAFRIVVFSSDEQEERPPTLREQMIVSIVRNRYRRGIPANITIAELHRHVAKPDVWKAECERRKIEFSQPPNRDSVARALRRASLID